MWGQNGFVMSDFGKLEKELSSKAKVMMLCIFCLLGIDGWLLQVPITEASEKRIEKEAPFTQAETNPNPPQLIENFLLTRSDPGRLVLPGRIVEWKDVIAGSGNRAAIGYGGNGRMLNYVEYDPSSSYEPLNAQYLVYYRETANTYQVVIQEYKFERWASTPYRSTGQKPGITSADRYIGTTFYNYQLKDKTWKLESVKVFNDAGSDTYYDGWRILPFGNYTFERTAGGLQIFDGCYSASGVAYTFLPNDITERGDTFKEHPERKRSLNASSPEIQGLALWKYFGQGS